MVPESLHDFFLAAAGVAGALIGLLFVAMTVASERLARDRDQVSRIRASAALTAFTNALAVSLFSLVPGNAVGPTAVAVGAGGLTFVAASLISLVRLRQLRWRTVRDALFLVGLMVLLVAQLVSGIQVIAHPLDSDAVRTIAILVAVCFLVGIDRSWELVGGPSIGIRQEVSELLRSHEPGDDDRPAGSEPPARGARDFRARLRR